MGEYLRRLHWALLTSFPLKLIETLFAPIKDA